MSKDEEGNVTLSKAALVVVITTCLGIGGAGSFFAVPRPQTAAQASERFEELRAGTAALDGTRAVVTEHVRMDDERVAVLKQRTDALEQRFEKVERTLERIDAKIDRVLAR